MGLVALLLFASFAVLHGLRAFDEMRRNELFDKFGSIETYTVCTDLTFAGFSIITHELQIEDECPVMVGEARYQRTMNETGWNRLQFIAKDESPAWAQAYAAGYIEGLVSRQLIMDHSYNLFDGYCKNAEKYCDRLFDFFVKNLAYIRKKIDRNGDDKYWRQVNVTIKMFEGLVEGMDGRKPGVTDYELVRHPAFIIQWAAEIWDLEMKFNRPQELRTRRGHCSAIVRVMEDLTGLVVAHTTWDSLASMLRVMRRYHFNMDDLPGQFYAYSGYPGTLASVDDFYINGASLVITETTNEMHSKHLLKHITPASVPMWIRSQVATRMAGTASDWVEYAKRENNGCYNNQWLIVDYKKFTPYRELEDGLFTIAEQIPGKWVSKEMTAYLREKQYFASYNRPYFTSVDELSGTRKMREKYGDFYSYENTTRAKMFARDWKKAVTPLRVGDLVRTNHYKTDPLSECKDCTPVQNPCLAIAARCDLLPANASSPIPDMIMRDMVATDAKFTFYDMIRDLVFAAVSGPPRYFTPTFSWTNSTLKDTVRHRSQPETFNFKFYTNNVI